MTLTGDLKKMSGDDGNVQTTHKKEAESRINQDGHDRQSLCAALESRIDPMDPVTHAAGCLINISNGQIAQTNVNVDRALEVGREQLKQFEASWPAGFYNTLSKQVVTFAERKKHLYVGESAIVDQEAIYARVIGLLVSQRDLDLQQVLAMELTAYPPSMSQADGEMQVATAGKSTLKNSLKVEVSQRLITSPTAIVMDVSAVLWTVDWPTHGTVGTFISGFKAWFRVRLSEADVHLCFDRYRDYSTKTSTRSSRAAATRVHQLDLKTPLPDGDAVLRNSANKAQLNSLICEQILIDEQYLQQVTQHHRLVVTGDDAVPIQVSKERNIPRLDIATTQEEADLIITQQAIHLAKEDGESRVCVLCDDTDVFALLVYFFSREQLQSSMTMRHHVGEGG